MKRKKEIQMTTHAVQFVYQGFGGFRWPIGYFSTATATAHQIFFTFWQAVDLLTEYDFNVHYCMLDGASLNRSFHGCPSHNCHQQSCTRIHHRSNWRDVTAGDHVVQRQRWWAKQTQRAATPLQRPAQAPRPSRRHFHEFVFRL